MKTFYLKQKLFSFKDKYKVFDESQNVVYHCEGHFFSCTRQKDFYETAFNQHLFSLKRKVFSFLPTYFLSNMKGEIVATIKKQFTFLKHKIDISSSYGDFSIEGNVFAYDFTIISNGEAVVDFHKKWLSWGDSYEISIYDEKNIPFFLALVIMIDDCFHSNQGNSSHHH